MTDITDHLTDFFARLTDDEEGLETLANQLQHRSFQFDLDDGPSFTLDANEDGVSIHSETTDDPDLVNDITVVRTSGGTLHDLMAGRLSPVDALNQGQLFMTSMMTARVYNYGLLRAFRRGAELAECSTYPWES